MLRRVTAAIVRNRRLTSRHEPSQRILHGRQASGSLTTLKFCAAPPRNATFLGLLVVSILASGMTPITLWSSIVRKAQANELTWESPNLRSVAVMPFINLSGDSESDFFAVGIAENLASSLARIRRLHVTGFNVSSHHGGAAFDSKTAAEELGVRYLVTGDVSWNGEFVRVKAELISAKTGKQVWTRQYSGTLPHIFWFELSVVDGIVTFLTSPLTLQERLKFYARNWTREPSAYVAVLRGKALLRRSGADSLKRAHKSFEVATQLDPNYGKAHVLLGHTYFLTSRFEDCLKTANRRVTHDLTIVALQVLRAICYGGLGRVEEAKRAGAEILRADPHFTIGRYSRSLPYGERSDLEKVFRALSMAGLPE